MVPSNGGKPPRSETRDDVSHEGDDPGLRKGKWSIEEEEYATAIIDQFTAGNVDITEGTTLRAYLAEKLNCDPMRITKKFNGPDCLGKRVNNIGQVPSFMSGLTDIQ